jgi:hypothetical protein
MVIVGGGQSDERQGCGTQCIAVYAREGESIRLVHVQSTALPD